MSLIWKIIRLPFLIWIAIGVGMAYRDYSEWESTTLTSLNGQLQGKSAEYNNVKRETSKAEEFRRRKEEKLRELQELSAKLEATRSQYPTSPNVSQLLKDLADVADRTGLEFHSFKPMAEKRQEFIVTTPIEVKLRGTYIQIMSFLDTAANLKRAVVAEKLALDNPTTRDGSVSLVNVSANLVTYSVDETADLSAPVKGGAAASSGPGVNKVAPRPVTPPRKGP